MAESVGNKGIGEPRKFSIEAFPGKKVEGEVKGNSAKIVVKEYKGMLTTVYMMNPYFTLKQVTVAPSEGDPAEEGYAFAWSKPGMSELSSLEAEAICVVNEAASFMEGKASATTGKDKKDGMFDSALKARQTAHDIKFNVATEKTFGSYY